MVLSKATGAAGRAQGLALRFLLELLVEARDIVVLDLDLVLTLDGGHDLDAHHGVDAQLLERGAVVLLGDLRHQGAQVLAQLQGGVRASSGSSSALLERLREKPDDVPAVAGSPRSEVTRRVAIPSVAYRRTRDSTGTAAVGITSWANAEIRKRVSAAP